MGTIANISDPVNAQDLPALRKAISRTLKAIIDQVNGNLTFGSNIASAGPYTVTFKDTNPVTIGHGLGRTPTGFILVNLTGGAIVYTPRQASLAWTNTTVSLQATAAVIATILLI